MSTMLQNKQIINSISKLSLSVMSKLITDSQDILYKPTNIVELQGYNELLHSVINRVISEHLGTINPEMMMNKGIQLSIPTSSILYIADIYTDGYDGVDDKIVTVVRNNLDIIHDMVKPVYMKYKEYIAINVHNRTNSNPLDKFNIHHMDLPELLVELENRGEFKVNDYDVILPNINKPLPLPEGSILGYMKTDIPRLDMYIDKTYNNQRLKNTWKRYLLKSINYQNLNNVYKIDIEEVLAVYLILKGLSDNLPDTLTGISLRDYRSVILKLIEYVKRVIAKYLLTINKYISSGIIMVSGKDTNITLISNNYINYINDDGDIETILGGLLSGKSILSKTQLIDNKRWYNDKWNMYVKKIRLTDANNLHRYYRQAYVLFFHKLLSELPYETYLLTRQDDMVIENEVVEFINGCNTAELRDESNIALYVITKILFIGTNSDMFLYSMVSYGKSDSLLSAKEIASLSTLEMIVQYLLTQISK